MSEPLGLHPKALARGDEWWAHQDSNLERAGYEPAALTIELWARGTDAEPSAIGRRLSALLQTAPG